MWCDVPCIDYNNGGSRPHHQLIDGVHIIPIIKTNRTNKCFRRIDHPIYRAIQLDREGETQQTLDTTRVLNNNNNNKWFIESALDLINWLNHPICIDGTVKSILDLRTVCKEIDRRVTPPSPPATCRIGIPHVSIYLSIYMEKLHE